MYPLTTIIVTVLWWAIAIQHVLQPPLVASALSTASSDPITPGTYLVADTFRDWVPPNGSLSRQAIYPNDGWNFAYVQSGYASANVNTTRFNLTEKTSTTWGGCCPGIYSGELDSYTAHGFHPQVFKDSLQASNAHTIVYQYHPQQSYGNLTGVLFVEESGAGGNGFLVVMTVNSVEKFFFSSAGRTPPGRYTAELGSVTPTDVIELWIDGKGDFSYDWATSTFSLYASCTRDKCASARCRDLYVAHCLGYIPTVTPTISPVVGAARASRTLTLEPSVPETEQPSTGAPTEVITEVPATTSRVRTRTLMNPPSLVPTAVALHRSRTITLLGMDLQPNADLSNLAHMNAETILTTVGVSSTAARALIVTGTASSGIAGVLTPTAASKANNVGRLVAVAACSPLADGADDDLLDPPWHQFLVIPLGSDPLGKARGALVFSTLAVLLLGGASLGAAKAQCSLKRQMLVSTLFATLFVFFGPNVVNLATTLLFASGRGQAFDVLIALAVFCIILAVFVAISVVIGFQTSTLPSERPSLLSLALYGWYDAAREPRTRIVRLIVVEDGAAAIAYAVLSAIPGNSRCTCIVIAVLALILSLLHLGYVTVVRPYAIREELGFACAIAVLQLLICLCALAVVLDSEGRVDSFPVRALGWLVLIMNVMFYVQLVALASLEVYRSWQRSKVQHSEKENGASSSTDLNEPLLVVQAKVRGEVPRSAKPANVNPLLSA